MRNVYLALNRFHAQDDLSPYQEEENGLESNLGFPEVFSKSFNPQVAYERDR